VEHLRNPFGKVGDELGRVEMFGEIKRKHVVEDEKKVWAFSPCLDGEERRRINFHSPDYFPCIHQSYCHRHIQIPFHR